MKTIQSVVFVALCLSFANCDIPGTLIGFARIASRAAQTCAPDSFANICGGCSTVLKCQFTNAPLEINCKTAYTDKPYCSNGICSAEPDADCAPTFTCTGAGYFPNPLNCSQYHLCSAAGATGTGVARYECPSNFVYNPATTRCKLSASPADCAVVDCSADPSGFAAYPADKTLYASCIPGGEPMMIRCPIYQVYRPASFDCVFQCPREGRIAVPNSLTAYYECYLDGSIYYYRVAECVAGYKFDQASQQCRP